MSRPTRSERKTVTSHDCISSLPTTLYCALTLLMLFVCADCDSPKSLLLCEVLASFERYHGLPPFSMASSASQIEMISDLLDAIAFEVKPAVSSGDGSNIHISVPGMPYATTTDVDDMSSLTSFDESPEEAVAACQFMADQTSCRQQIYKSIFGDDSDEDVSDESADEYEDDDPPMPTCIARTKPNRLASTSTLIGIRKSLWAEKDIRRAA